MTLSCRGDTLRAAMRSVRDGSRRRTAGQCRRSASHHVPDDNRLLRIQPRVRDALANGRPVVALESTIVAHGMPYPQNLELAREIETLLEEQHGVTPATIAVRNGRCCVGLSSDELEDLAQSPARKCSTRDLPLILAKHGREASGDNDGSRRSRWGATTVASTMRIAHMAGIPTFVTGGIGGVHRDGENTMDVSADLLELSQTPVIVVSAGIKSILDISRTLEVLETNSVPTVSWQTDEFPAFFSPHSGCATPARMDTAEEVAAAYQAARLLRMTQGMLVAVPNQDPAGASVERAIRDALVEAKRQNVVGQAVTPFILKRVTETTDGDSLRSNMALVKQNARVGAAIAKAVASTGA